MLIYNTASEIWDPGVCPPCYWCWVGTIHEGSGAESHQGWGLWLEQGILHPALHSQLEADASSPCPAGFWAVLTRHLEIILCPASLMSELLPPQEPCRLVKGFLSSLRGNKNWEPHHGRRHCLPPQDNPGSHSKPIKGRGIQGLHLS